MADGTFDSAAPGNAISRAIMMRYQAAQAQAQQTQSADLARLRARGELLGRLTLQSPGATPGAPSTPAPFSAYLSALNGGEVPAGTTAEPTPAFGAAARAGSQDKATDQKAKEEALKAATAQRTHWAQMLQPGEVKPASYFAPAEILKQYNIDPSEKISSSQKPAGAGKAGAGKNDIKAADVQKLLGNVRTQFKDAGFLSQHFGDASRLPSVQKALQNIEAGVTAKTIKNVDDIKKSLKTSVASGDIKPEEAVTIMKQFQGGGNG